METKRIFTTIWMISLTIELVKTQCLTEDDTSQKQSRSSLMNLYAGQQDFTLSLLDSINKATPNENIFFSPYSTFHTLLLAYFGANNMTEQELRNVLKLDWAQNKIQVMQAYRVENRMRAKRLENSPLEFISANKIYISNEVELRDCMKNLFDSELENLDFLNQPERSRTEINNWVQNTTKGQIKDFLNSDSITSQTKLVLANAAYFKGQWASKFNANDTKPGIFYTSTEKRTLVDMMSKTGQFNHAVNEQLEAHILELPYEGTDSEISMIIFLPPFMPEAIETLLKKLTPETLRYALDEGMSREIEVKLPKFSFEKTIELRPVLERLNVGNIFSHKADLSGFSDKTSLNLDDAVHKAKIEVDEEGSTAAAATALFSFRSSRPLEPTQFVCNHPFLFLIFDHKSDAILFTGIYRGPDN